MDIMDYTPGKLKKEIKKQDIDRKELSQENHTFYEKHSVKKPKLHSLKGKVKFGGSNPFK